MSNSNEYTPYVYRVGRKYQAAVGFGGEQIATAGRHSSRARAEDAAQDKADLLKLQARSTCPRCGARAPHGLNVAEVVVNSETFYYLACQSCDYDNRNNTKENNA